MGLNLLAQSSHKQEIRTKLEFSKNEIWNKE